MFRTLLSALRQRLSPAPSPPRLSAARNPAPATASLPPVLRRRLESKGTGGRTEAASATSGVSFPTLQAETWEKGGGCLSFFLSQNPGITTLLGFMRIVHCSLRRWLSIKARIDSLGNKLKNPPQAFQQNYLRY